MKREKLGEIFVKAGIISQGQLVRVIAENRRHPEEKLGQTLVRLKLASDTDIARALSLQLNIPYEVPQDFEAIEAARFATGLNIRPHVAPASEILAAINRYYAVEESVGTILQDVTPSEDVELILKHLQVNEQQIEELKKQSESPAIVKMVNTIILLAGDFRASQRDSDRSSGARSGD
jgi:hypothetical protein